MTPWVRATVLLIVVGAGGAVFPYGSARAYGGESAPRATAWASVVPSAAAVPSRAGSRAGEGRERPGRREPVESDPTEPAPSDSDPAESGPADPEPAPADEEVQDAEEGVDGDGDSQADGEVTAVPEAPLEPTPVPSAAPTRGVDNAVGRPAEPRLQILPLGGGLILVGLGLGLAFIALRVRRGAS